MEVGATPRLRAAVESAIPNRVYVGRGAVLFVHGWCYHEERRIARLSLRVGDQRHEVPAHSMPRADLLRERDPARDPGGHAFRSGFWALVPLPAIERPARAELELVASLRGGGEASHPLGEIDLDPGQGLAPRGGAPERRRHGSTPGRDLHGDPQSGFHPPSPAARLDPGPDAPQLDLPDQRRPLGSRRLRDARGRDRGRRALLASAGRSTAAATTTTSSARSASSRARPSFVALSDQDDHWHPDKLSTLIDAARGEGVTLAYSDMRLTDESGDLISSTYWTERRNNHTNLATLLVANTITAAASLFPRALLERALPFPPRIGDAFHDHWLALVALASGRIAYVERPLYDYVQHQGNAYGIRGARWAPSAPAPPEHEPHRAEPVAAAPAGRLLRRRGTRAGPRRAPRPALRRLARRAQGAHRRPLPALAGRSPARSPSRSGNRCARSGRGRAGRRRWAASASSPEAWSGAV